MVAPEKNRPVAGQRQADHAKTAQTDVSFSLAHGADIGACTGYFLHDPSAPCFDQATRRLYALSAYYVYDLLRDLNDILQNIEPDTSIDLYMLLTILRSSLRIRRRTAEHIIDALVACGLLVRHEVVRGGVAHE